MPLVGLFLNLFKILHGIEVQPIRLQGQGPCAVFEHSSHFFHEGAAVLQPPHSCKPVLVKEPSKQRPQRK